MHSLSWAAGFFDGEGCVVAYRDKRNGAIRLQLEANQTDPRPLKLLQTLFGGRINKRIRRRSDKERQLYIWSISGEDAAKTAYELAKHSVVKQEQLDALARLTQCQKEEADRLIRRIATLKKIEYL